jgi:hypothetical protein
MYGVIEHIEQFRSASAGRHGTNGAGRAGCERIVEHTSNPELDSFDG